MATSQKKGLLKHTAMLGLALMLGAAGVYYSKAFIEEKINFYKEKMTVKDEMVEAVVPNMNLRKGQVVNATMLSLRSFPKKYIDVNYVKNNTYNSALGQKLAFDVQAGMPLLWSHLQGGTVPTFSGKIKDGLRALTVPVDEVNSISGFLQPDDNVDLILTYSGDRKQGKVIMPLIQNLKVMATGVKTIVDRATGAVATRFNTITVHVSSEQAKKIILAQDVGNLTATLRHPDDELIDSQSIMTVNDLLGIPNAKKSKPKPLKTYRASKPKAKPGIEFIIGNR